MAKKSSSPPTDKRSFEEIVGRLEEIAESLETGEPKLEDALGLFEEGVQLTKEGTRRLDQAELKIEVLLEDNSVANLSVAPRPGSGQAED